MAVGYYQFIVRGRRSFQDLRISKFVRLIVSLQNATSSPKRIVFPSGLIFSPSFSRGHFLPSSLGCEFVIGVGSLGVLVSLVLSGMALVALKIPSAEVRKPRIESWETPSLGGSFFCYCNFPSIKKRK